MRLARTIADLRDALETDRRAGRTIALVPTMGALHEGHLSLIRAAREQADVVVVSLFVNPTQFNDAADLRGSPRDEDGDAALAQGAGADVLFAPGIDEVYPHGTATTVSVRGPLTETLEAAHRGTAHFDGVTTVVAKLLHIVGPDVAVFGRKDAQQALVVAQMVRDLNLPVRLDVRPTVRDADGLALSSRNARLDAAARERALALPATLHAAAGELAAGSPAREVEARGLQALRDAGLEPEYLAIADPVTLTATDLPDALILAAVTVDGVRLIDNVPAGAPTTIAIDAEVATPA